MFVGFSLDGCKFDEVEKLFFVLRFLDYNLDFIL